MGKGGGGGLEGVGGGGERAKGEGGRGAEGEEGEGGGGGERGAKGGGAGRKGIWDGEGREEGYRQIPNKCLFRQRLNRSSSTHYFYT